MSISDEELSRVRSSSKPVRSPSSRNRSRITNGAAVLTDARSAWGRLRLDTSRALISHVGGDDMVSETQRLAIRRISALEAELVHLETSFAEARAAGREPDMAKRSLYGSLADRQRRLSEPLGWQRTARDLTPSFQEYAAMRGAEKDADASDADAPNDEAMP